MIAVQEEERKRIAGEIHDSLGQSLIARKFMIDEAAYAFRDIPEVVERCSTIEGFIDQTVSQARELSHTLSPLALQKIGLGRAIRGLLEPLAANKRLEIHSSLEPLDEAGTHGFQEEIHVYRIVQESLTNALKHSEATRIEVLAEAYEGNLQIVVRDNGVGFDRNEHGGGIGFLLMHERARLTGAELWVKSAPGSGTEVGLATNIRAV